MIGLRELVIRSGYGPDEEILKAPEGAATVEQLLGLAKDLPARYVGSSVALKLASPFQFVKALFYLDGRASNILLLASDLKSEIVETLIEAAPGTELIDDMSLVGENCADSSHLSKEGMAPSTWCLSTSGTTGVPKIVRHQFPNLIRSVKLPKAGQERPVWGLLYEPSRFAGLQVVLQAFGGGGILVLTDPEADLQSRLEFLARHGCTHLSATPSLWRKILMLPHSHDLDLRQITLGGEIADQRVLDGLRQRFPNARLTHIFASTEIGVGFSVVDGRAGFPASYLSKSLSGLRLKVKEGVLWACPPDGMPRTVANHIQADDEGYICTEDRVEVSGDRVLFLGRQASQVNIGGIKLQLEELERQLRDHPDIAECALSAIPNPIVGNILVLDVVPNMPVEDEGAFKRSLKKWCRTHFQPEAVPAKVMIVSSLALASSGKVRRH
ncbi:AMP-binding protein [Novosphingobium mangrovi (ex Huang et al. 2023)]|uniref:Long-chain-fatty-acid--CoA ligase n=1 Tax=Novosphingobium mangrovi (ex Huang et al. 2023) TaxID=2976432 RepID=A0ABT2I0T6_9SPHN|nr:AMP-binding protein [Novosphingobium mangrovi (ex Huang et al. 2023)]MCT2398416.1 AMP-binding protein [Novosphingobium mangrovi (ex Huang et al. 2023)]